jgi:hypothetical protein
MARFFERRRFKPGYLYHICQIGTTYVLNQREENIKPEGLFVHI